MTIHEFLAIHNRESWKGTWTAFAAGVNARLFNRECNYWRIDFQDAWKRGFAAMDAYIVGGGRLLIPADRPRKKRWTRHIYG